jgi:hypothetical protein
MSAPGWAHRLPLAARPMPDEHRLYRRHCQSPSPECAHHGQMRCDRRFRHPIPGKSRPNPGRFVGEKPWTCRRVETFLVVLRPMRLLAVRNLKRSSKSCWGARQHRQRGDMLWIAVGEQPGEAATPIMANQMKRRSPCPVARRCVARRRSAGRRGSCPSRWIGPGVDRITALVPRHREIARFSSPGAWLCQKSRDTQNPCNIKTQRRSWQRRRPKHRKPSQEPSQFRALR